MTYKAPQEVTCLRPVEQVGGIITHTFYVASCEGCRVYQNPRAHARGYDMSPFGLSTLNRCKLLANKIITLNSTALTTYYVLLPDPIKIKIKIKTVDLFLMP